MAVSAAARQAVVHNTMRRKNFKNRIDYHERLNEIGFQYHSVLSTDKEQYWTEGVAYEFTLAQIEEIESASQTLHDLCMETVRDIVEAGDYPDEFRLNDESKSLIEQSWENGDIHVYGRFDLLVEPSGKIKMYE